MRDTKNWGNPSRWACARTARVSVLLRFYFLPYYHLKVVGGVLFGVWLKLPKTFTRVGEVWILGVRLIMDFGTRRVCSGSHRYAPQTKARGAAARNQPTHIT